MPKLKDHLFQRIQENVSNDTTSSALHPSPAIEALKSAQRNSILFQGDRMYKHQIVRINYTTYDVRRAQDVTNADTSHCHVMVLASPTLASAVGAPFCFARVLGAYHVNVVYTGAEARNYKPRQMHFLWVRWFSNVLPMQNVSKCKLDQLEFPPVNDEDSFGFLDPSDILRSCHIIPSFTSSKVHLDGKGLSLCAKDAQDYARYYIGR